jgi:hypothetical protein
MMLAVGDDALGMRQHHFPGVPILFSGIAASRNWRARPLWRAYLTMWMGSPRACP